MQHILRMSKINKPTSPIHQVDLHALVVLSSIPVTVIVCKQKSRLDITSSVVVVASTVSISNKGRQKKCDHTKKSPENSIPHVYHNSMLMNMEMATFLSHIFQHIPMSWVPVS